MVSDGPSHLSISAPFQLALICTLKMRVMHFLFALFVIVVTVPETTHASCGIFQGATLKYYLDSLTVYVVKVIGL